MACLQPYLKGEVGGLSSVHLRSTVLNDLQRRNRRAFAMWEVCEEAMRTRQELLSARAASQEMEQRALAASLLSRNSVIDVGGLLGDTPIAPHMRPGVASFLGDWLRDGRGGGDRWGSLENTQGQLVLHSTPMARPLSDFDLRLLPLPSRAFPAFRHIKPPCVGLVFPPYPKIVLIHIPAQTAYGPPD